MISKLRTRSRATKAGLCPPPSAVPASVGGDADDVRVRIRASGSAVAGKLPGLLAASTQGRSDENGHVVEGAVFTWSSSDARVALVYLLSGLVRGAGEGTATITATAGDASGTSEITVVHPDRVALVALYNATDGPNWVDNTNWLTDAPLGEWYGVRTNGQGRVVRLDLSGIWDSEARQYVSHGLRGELPGDLASLTQLTYLSLSNNDLSGPIPPELGGLSNLGYLHLTGNALSGAIPPELGDLANLEQLYLSGNTLSGAIPPELGDLANLEQLRLSGNDLTGAIPPELGDLANLEQLYLHLNTLSGAIPPELGDLANLESLRLSGNDLTGAIPPELGDLANQPAVRRMHLPLAQPQVQDVARLPRRRHDRMMHAPVIVAVPRAARLFCLGCPPKPTGSPASRRSGSSGSSFPNGSTNDGTHETTSALLRRWRLGAREAAGRSVRRRAHVSPVLRTEPRPGHPIPAGLGPLEPRTRGSPGAARAQESAGGCRCRPVARLVAEGPDSCRTGAEARQGLPLAEAEVRQRADGPAVEGALPTRRLEDGQDSASVLSEGRRGIASEGSGRPPPGSQRKSRVAGVKQRESGLPNTQMQSPQ